MTTLTRIIVRQQLEIGIPYWEKRMNGSIHDITLNEKDRKVIEAYFSKDYFYHVYNVEKVSIDNSQHRLLIQVYIGKDRNKKEMVHYIVEWLEQEKVTLPNGRVLLFGLWKERLLPGT